jgi:hypothetical protein
MPKQLFQALNLLAQRRLSDPQQLRSLTEMQRLRHRKKVAKMTKVNLFFHTTII